MLGFHGVRDYQAQLEVPSKRDALCQVHFCHKGRVSYLSCGKDHLRNQEEVATFFFDGPMDHKCPIFIQQDNIKTHVLECNPVVIAAGMNGRWSIAIKNQPPNSPDFNVLDLGIFNALSKSQSRVVKSNTDDLIATVYGAFKELPTFEINHCFLTPQRLMSEVVTYGGGNNYSLPHMHKSSLVAAKHLPDWM